MICPDCNWESPPCSYVVLKNGSIETEGFLLRGTVYPLILEKKQNHKGQFYWREVHRCPKCVFEFEDYRFDK